MNVEDIEKNSKGGMYFNGIYVECKIKVLEVRRIE